MLEMTIDEQFMREALKEAQYAYDEGEVPIGAIVVINGRIIAKAHNQVERLNDPTAHAELLALTQATNTLGGKYLRDCTLYVTVEPCTMCAGALRWTQLGRLVYGTEEDKCGYHCFCKQILHPKTSVHSGIYQEECKKLMQDFFRAKRLR